MTNVQTPGTSLATVMGGVTTLRILHSAAPAARGDGGTLEIVGIDNITPLSPTAVSLSGLSASHNGTSLLVIGAALLLLTLSSFLIGRRSRYAA